MCSEGKGYAGCVCLADLVKGFCAAERHPDHLVGKDAQRAILRYLQQIECEFWPEPIRFGLALCAVTISMVVAGAGCVVGQENPRAYAMAPVSLPGVSAEPAAEAPLPETLPAPQAVPAGMSLDQAISATLLADPKIRAGLEAIHQANADWLTSSLPPNPTLITDGIFLPLRPITPAQSGRADANGRASRIPHRLVPVRKARGGDGQRHSGCTSVRGRLRRPDSAARDHHRDSLLRCPGGEIPARPGPPGHRKLDPT